MGFLFRAVPQKHNRDQAPKEKRTVKPLALFGVFVLAVTVSVAQTASPTKGRTAKQRMVPATEVEELRAALAAQQRQMEQQRQQIEQLQSQLERLIDANQPSTLAAEKSQSSLQQVESTAAQAQQSAAEAQRRSDQASANAVEAKSALAVVHSKSQEEEKKIGALEGVLGRFRFNGDIRVRGESFFQDGIPDRNRARIRARFGVDGKLNEDITGGLYLATGSLGDPTTTNETLTNFFDRKTIAVDRAFITYNPIAHKWISLTGGKFAYLWQRTGTIGDQDINPEGFNEKFSFDLKSSVLKNLTLHGIQYLFNEVNAGAGSTAVAAQDSYALGGQISLKLQFGPWTTTPSFLSMKWNRPDSILEASGFALQATTTGSAGTTPAGPFPLPGEGPGCQKVVGGPGFPPCPFAANGMTNATFVDRSGKAHFFSGFNYADFILSNQIRTGWERLPINLLLEYEQNLDAEDHPLDSKGAIMSQLGPQNKEYGFDFSVGQTKNRNDIQIGYTWYRQEQDSVIASFAESDQRTPTNLIQNKIYALWKVRSNTVASLTWWHGRVLNSNLENNAALVQKTVPTAGENEPYLNRLQFDLIYTF
jgi:Putative porin